MRVRKKERERRGQRETGDQCELLAERRVEGRCWCCFPVADIHLYTLVHTYFTFTNHE